MAGTRQIAADLVAAPRGILAADESVSTMSKRLVAAGVRASPDSRRDYRELLITTPGLSAWIAGVILCDETLRQRLADGTPVPEAARRRGLQVGIKVDTGVRPLPFADGGGITEGLDGLAARLVEYRRLGATFAKWRAVIEPTGLHPRTVAANAHALARYAALCQEAGIVPIVEPEVVMDGAHSAAMCQAVTANTLRAVFDQLDHLGANPAGIVLKTNMVVSGERSGAPSDPDEVARMTLHVLRQTVPATVPGVAFLSGGQRNDRACTNLAAIAELAARQGGVPWRLTFSFGRALVNDALNTWRGDVARAASAQQVLADNCARAAAATDAPEVVDAVGA